MLPDVWPAVREIYREGIITGNATFETELPDWEKWDSSHLYQADDGIRDYKVTGVQTCALPICGVSRDALNAWMMDSPGCQVQGRDASEALRKQDGIVSVAGSYVEGRFARANQAHQVPLPFGLARVRPE